MNDNDTTELRHRLKQLILDETDKDDAFAADEIGDDEPLFGPDSRLSLDSLDALQISVAIGRRYGVRIEGSRDGRTAFASINHLAAFINARL